MLKKYFNEPTFLLFICLWISFIIVGWLCHKSWNVAGTKPRNVLGRNLAFLIIILSKGNCSRYTFAGATTDVSTTNILLHDRNIYFSFLPPTNFYWSKSVCDQLIRSFTALPSVKSGPSINYVLQCSQFLILYPFSIIPHAFKYDVLAMSLTSLTDCSFPITASPWLPVAH